MNRPLPPARRPVARTQHRGSPSGLSGADVIGPLHACFTTVTDVLTDHAIQALGDHLSSINFRGGHCDPVALRNAIRQIVAEWLLDGLRESITESETEPDV